MKSLLSIEMFLLAMACLLDLKWISEMRFSGHIEVKKKLIRPEFLFYFMKIGLGEELILLIFDFLII